jgi:hypothetical protein
MVQSGSGFQLVTNFFRSAWTQMGVALIKKTVLEEDVAPDMS